MAAISSTASGSNMPTSSTDSDSNVPPSSTVSGFNVPTFILPNFSQMAIEKLEGEDNYLQWLSQIKPIIRSNDLKGIINGSEVCPPQFLSNENGQKTLNPEFTC
jgi:hypothetical protein